MTRRGFFLASLGLSVALCVWLVAYDARAHGALLAALVALALVGALAARRAGGLLVALGILNLLTLAPELALRATGFRFVSGVQFGYPQPAEFWELIPDEQLFWTLPPSRPGDPVPVNSLGFIGPEPASPKPAGVLRVVVLGDSCSQQGWPASWPDLAVAQLRARGVPAELVNLSMSGYSTHQGRALALGMLQELAPDLVLVWYGWNDHWLAYGAVDSQKRASLGRERLYRRSRLLQGLRKLAVDAGLADGAPRLELPRVPPDEYRANLMTIVTASEAAGAQVALVTAPTSHRLMGVPDYLVTEGFAEDDEAVLRRHEEYVELTRVAAKEAGAALFDLDAEFETDPELARAFTADGIHLTEDGRRSVAEKLVRKLLEAGLTTPAARKRP